MTIQTYISSVRDRIAKATPGPWIKRPLALHEGGDGYEIVNVEEKTILDDQTYYPSAPDDLDGELIASAPTDLSLLCDALEVAIKALEHEAEDTEASWGSRAAKQALEQINRMIGEK